MISFQKEERIHQLLADGVPYKHISDEVGISRSTIQKIKKLSEIRKRKPLIPYFLKIKARNGRRKLKDHIKCNTCGASLNIWPCISCQVSTVRGQKREAYSTETEIAKAALTEVLELFLIVEDLRSLYDLNLIKHQLFFDLAQRSKRCLSRIFLKQAGICNDAKKNTIAK